MGGGVVVGWWGCGGGEGGKKKRGRGRVRQKRGIVLSERDETVRGRDGGMREV